MLALTNDSLRPSGQLDSIAICDSHYDTFLSGSTVLGLSSSG